MKNKKLYLTLCIVAIICNVLGMTIWAPMLGISTIAVVALTILGWIEFFNYYKI